LLLDNPQAGIRISEMLHRMTIGQELLAYCARRLDAGDPIVAEVAMAVKVSATETGIYAADLLIQLLGGRGYMENNLAPQIFRDVRMLSIGEGANEGLLAAIGRGVRMTDSVDIFLRRYQNRSELAQQLSQISEELGSAGDSGPFTGNATVAWRDAQRGRLAVLALEVAAAEAEASRTPGYDEMLTWARLQWDRACREARQGPDPSATALPSDRIRPIIDAFREIIGDVEPMAPDVDWALDPLLRRDPPPMHAASDTAKKRELLRKLLLNEQLRTAR
jgi:Acyl-CoA dehydrogenase, C-terminal domain